MDTAMSTKKGVVDTTKTEEKTHYTLPVVALVCGFLVMILGIAVDVLVLAAIGFVAFVSGFLYLNSLYWSHVYKDGKMDIPDIDKYSHWI